MAGLGGIADQPEKLDTQATLDKTKRSISRADELAKTEWAVAAPALATGKQPAGDLTVKLPDLGQLSADAVAFLKTPMKANSLLDAVKKSTEATAKGVEMQIKRAREIFNNNAKVFTKEQQEKLFNYLISLRLFKLRDAAIDLVNISQKKGDKVGRDSGLSVGQAATKTLADLGIGSINKNQEDFLRKAAEGLNDTQKNDMLRAALQMGFSTAAVFSIAKPKGTVGAATMPISSERDIMTQQLVRAAIETATRLNFELQRAKREFESDDSQENREKYEASKVRLSNFLGSKASVDDLIELGSTETEIVTKAVMGHVGASYNLHTGQPSGVMPKKAPKRGMA